MIRAVNLARRWVRKMRARARRLGPQGRRYLRTLAIQPSMKGTR